MNALAVIEADAAAANTARRNDPYTSPATIKACAKESAAARAAIAGLIEADKAYDTARSRYDHAFRDGPHGNLDEQRDAQHMLREAKKRRAAALARVGG